MIDLLIGQLWDLRRWRSKGGQSIREVMVARLCKVLWNMVRSLYFILSERETIEEVIEEKSLNWLAFLKDHSTCCLENGL